MAPREKKGGANEKKGDVLKAPPPFSEPGHDNGSSRLKAAALSRPI
jgi:hypothetical protein